MPLKRKSKGKYSIRKKNKKNRLSVLQLWILIDWLKKKKIVYCSDIVPHHSRPNSLPVSFSPLCPTIHPNTIFNFFLLYLFFFFFYLNLILWQFMWIACGCACFPFSDLDRTSILCIFKLFSLFLFISMNSFILVQRL